RPCTRPSSPASSIRTRRRTRSSGRSRRVARMTYVTVERQDDGVAVVRLDRPKVNALSKDLLSELRDVAARLIGDPPGAVVVMGSERVFSAGAEISEFGGPKEAREIGGLFRDALGAVA